jgi:hypothetical protein
MNCFVRDIESTRSQIARLASSVSEAAGPAELPDIIAGLQAACAQLQAAYERQRDFEAIINRSPAVVFRWCMAPDEWPVEYV